MTTTEDALPFFRELEESLFRLDIRASPSEVDHLLADEFVEFGSAGLVFSKRDVINALQAEPPIHRTLNEFRAHQLAPDVMLLTYRSIRRSESDPSERHFLRSSIWKKIDGRWQMIFHQGTPAQPR